jgi:hypothetical protein
MDKMKKINVLIIITIFFSFLFIIELVSGLTLNSSNYSVGRFGTGMATSNASSNNSEALFLSESQGTTRNAESDTYTTNVGFFDNTPYYRAVSITSYSIYPKSAVNGSIIRLSVSALNSESVWAVLTLPDSSQETIPMDNGVNLYYTANQVGKYNITFYANTSQGNLASVIDSFDITSPIIPPVNPPSGGGGTTKIIKECTYVWDCSPWTICLNENQTRECKNIGNCTGIEGKPIETRKCSDALFDVTMKLNELEITQNKTLKFNIDLTEKEGIEKIDVQIKYSIIDSNKTEIFSQIETRAVQGNLSYEKKINDIKLDSGEYVLRVDILYGNLQRAFAEQKFNIISGGMGKATQKEKNLVSFFKSLDYRIVILIALLIFILIIILILIILVRKRSKEEGIRLIEENLREGYKLLADGKIDEAKGKYRNIKNIYHIIGHTNNEVYSKVMAFYIKVNRI